MRLNALRPKQVGGDVPMGVKLRVQSELKSIPIWLALCIHILLTSAHRLPPPTSKGKKNPFQISIDIICPFPNWGFLFQSGDYVWMCLVASSLCRGVSIQSISQHRRGQKRHPFLLLGFRGGWLWWCGGVTPINPPQLPPQRVGVMSGMSQVPLSPWCTVFGNPSPSILSCYTQPPPTLPPTATSHHPPTPPSPFQHTH